MDLHGLPLEQAEWRRRTPASFRDTLLADFLRGDIAEIGNAPLSPGATYDTVFAGCRLHDIADYRSALQSWFAAVRPGGHLVIIVPHAFLYERQLALPSRFRPDQPRLYTPGSLTEEIEESLTPNSYRIRLLCDDDRGYDYARTIDQDPAGACDLMLAIERIAPPSWDLSELARPVKAQTPDFAFDPPRTRIEVVRRKSARRILILKLDHLGDFIMGLPALERARVTFADAEITLVVGSWNLDLARDVGVADRVLAFDVFPRNSSEERVDVAGKTALFQKLIDDGYDLAIDLRSDPDTRFLLRNVRAGVRAGIGTRAQFPFLDIFLPIDGTRNEPETARVDELNHHMFASQPGAVRGDFRIFCAKECAQSASAMIWGPYRPLRTGRYIFEPYVELGATGNGLLSFDVALDAQWIVHKHVPAPEPVRLAFTVDKPDALFEFRIWALEGVEALDFSFFGGRLIREGAASVLHQSEYLMLLIELIRLRVAEYGLLEDIGATP